MITASNEFITAVEQTSRQWSARFVLNGEVLDCDISKITCYKGSCGNDLAVGCVYAPYIEATLRRCNTNIDGETLTYQVGVNTGSDYDYIDVGKFTVMDPSAGNGSVMFTGVGTLGRVGNNSYTTALTYPATITAICNELASAIGATIRFQGFTSTDTSCTVATAITGQIRDVLGTIAGLLGGFVAEDNAGNIVIAKYNSGGTFSILPHRTLDIPKVRETPFSVLGIHITVAEATQDEEGQTIPEVYYEYGTPVIFQTNAWMTQALFNRLVANFVGLVFDLSSIDIALGDPRIEPWDVISLTDLAGNTHSIPCFSITHTYDGGFTSTVEAVVESANTSSVRVKGALEKYVERLDSDVYAAKTAAAQAKASADEASRLVGEIEEDVDRATTLLGNMEAAATQAGTTLTQIYQDATDARTSAINANASAHNATVYANSALDHLSVVENIVGVLDLLQKNGDYQITEDSEVQPNKWYFTRSGTDPNYVYSVVENPTSVYHLTEDTAIETGKTYYTRTGAGTEENPYVYTAVVNPVVADIATYYEKYYELVNIDTAIQNYVSSHLAIDGRGLWVQNGADAGATKILLSSQEGIKLYRGADIIAQYGATTQIGNENGFHIKIDGSELGFFNGGGVRIAYLNGQQLYITKSVVLQQMDLGTPYGYVDPVTGITGLGQWSWKVHPNGETPSRNNLNLKWVG